MLTNFETAQADELKSLLHASDMQRLEAGSILLVMKRECQHGAWLPFLERAGINERRAQRLMQKARAVLISDKLSDLGLPKQLEEIMRLLRAEPDARVQSEQARAVIDLCRDVLEALGKA